MIRMEQTGRNVIFPDSSVWLLGYAISRPGYGYGWGYGHSNYQYRRSGNYDKTR